MTRQTQKGTQGTINQISHINSPRRRSLIWTKGNKQNTNKTQLPRAQGGSNHQTPQIPTQTHRGGEKTHPLAAVKETACTAGGPVGVDPSPAGHVHPTPRDTSGTASEDVDSDTDQQHAVYALRRP